MLRLYPHAHTHHEESPLTLVRFSTFMLPKSVATEFQWLLASALRHIVLIHRNVNFSTLHPVAKMAARKGTLITQENIKQPLEDVHCCIHTSHVFL